MRTNLPVYFYCSHNINGCNCSPVDGVDDGIDGVDKLLEISVRVALPHAKHNGNSRVFFGVCKMEQTPKCPPVPLHANLVPAHFTY